MKSTEFPSWLHIASSIFGPTWTLLVPMIKQCFFRDKFFKNLILKTNLHEIYFPSRTRSCLVCSMALSIFHQSGKIFFQKNNCTFSQNITFLFHHNVSLTDSVNHILFIRKRKFFSQKKYFHILKSSIFNSL